VPNGPLKVPLRSAVLRRLSGRGPFCACKPVTELVVPSEASLQVVAVVRCHRWWDVWWESLILESSRGLLPRHVGYVGGSDALCMTSRRSRGRSEAVVVGDARDSRLGEWKTEARELRGWCPQTLSPYVDADAIEETPF